MTARIDNINGHGLLRCECAFFEILPDEADVQGVNPYTRDNVLWLPLTLDMTQDPVVLWHPRRDLPEYVQITCELGETHVLRMSYEDFDELYVGWLRKQTQYPDLN